jgi:hypothetical protein
MFLVIRGQSHTIRFRVRLSRVVGAKSLGRGQSRKGTRCLSTTRNVFIIRGHPAPDHTSNLKPPLPAGERGQGVRGTIGSILLL